jgi:flavorubredoxin
MADMAFEFTHYQIAPDLHMFRTHMGRVDLMFNSYVLLAERPVLIHTGSRPMWENLRRALTAVLPLERLAYVLVPHFEADECGALSLLLQEAQPTVVASRPGAGQLMGFGIVEKPQGMGDGDRLDLGDRELELIGAPSEMHLWEGLLAFDHKRGTLFSADFLSQMGGQTPHAAAVPDLALMAQMAKGNIPATQPFERVVKRLLGLEIQMVAPGHGASFTERIPELVTGYFAHTLPVGT